MSFEKSLIAKRLLDTQFQIGSMHNDKLFVESLPMIEEALQSEELKKVEVDTGARARFLYLKAVALDMTGKAEESLEILIDLVKQYPGAPDYEISLRVVCDGIEKRARDLVNSNPDSPLVKSFHSVLEQYAWSPYWLIHAVAAQEAAEGKVDIAWGRMQALLALSPNDDDYLRCALDIATRCKLPAKRHELLSHLQTVLESHPYRLDLVELLSVQGGGLSLVSSGT